MKLNALSQKKWFSWILIAVLIVSNVISYKAVEQYFSRINQSNIEEVKVENSMIGGGNRIIDWAKEILRFFRNP